MLQTKVSQWPYPAVNATVSPSRMGMYASKHAGFPINFPNVRVPSFSRLAGYDGMFDQNVYGRQSFSVDQGINHEDYQTPGYMIPSSLPDYSGIWNQKAWNANPNLKAQNGAIFPDQDENPVPQSTYPYMLPDTGTSPPEIPSVVPTMALPSDGQSQTERTLPNPANRQAPASMSAVPAPDAILTLPFGNPWAARAAVPSGQTSMPTSSGCFSSSMNRPKLNQPTTAQDMAFGYFPVNTTTDSPPPIQSISTQGMDPVVDSSSAEPRVSRSFSRDNTSTDTNNRLLGLGDYTPDIYGYSTSEKSRTRGSGSGSGSEADDSGSATLLNGLPYTRVRHPEQSNSALAFNLLPTEPSIPEYRPPPPEAQREVSPLGSNGF